MKLRFKPLLISLAVSTVIGGCAVTPHSEKMKYEPLQSRDVTFVPATKSTYVREVTPDEDELSKKVSLVGVVSLIDALRLKLPNNSIIPKDLNIDLKKMINVSAKGMYVKDYLEYLSALSGYEIKLNDRKIEVRSFVDKEWNLAVFASKRNVNLKVGRSFDTSRSGDGASGDTDNTISTTFDDDEWSVVVEGTKKILNVKESASGDDVDKDRLLPYVQAVRSVGMIHAGGTPQRMKAVDEFISSLIESGSKQVNISVKAFDVVLNDDRGAGIDWGQLATVGGKINGNDFGLDFSTLTNNILTSENTLFQNNVTYESSKVKADFLLKFLSQFGEVELLNQPNVTVRNGSYAYIATGEELTYIGEVEKEVINGIQTITKTLDSIRVGVTLAVTPRILQDGRILLDIWPVVSSSEGSDIFTIDGEIQRVPRIALQELSTQVIAESGKPIQLGGFIRRAIAKSLEELPWTEKLTGAVLKPNPAPGRA